MSERIQQTCTVHKSDVFAVLVTLEDVISEALKSGEIVRLGDLGTFQIGISSKGALTEEDYDETLIKKKIGGEESPYYEFSHWSPSLSEPIVGTTKFYA